MVLVKHKDHAYMGLDIGTSGCKAVAFDAHGYQLGREYREYDLLLTGDGGAELDSGQVIAACCEVVRACAAGIAPRRVAALAVSSQGEAFTAVDKRGRPLCRAMVSSDTRPASLAESWSSQFGARRLYQITGHTAHPMFTLYKLLWLKNNRPSVWAAATGFFCFEDLFHRRLGLEPCIGYSLAGRTMLFDIRRQEWSAEILAAAGLSPEKLARPVEAGTAVGYPAPEILKELGLPANTLVVSGGHDQPVGALGAGVIRSGSAMYATGTVECITPVLDRAVFSDRLMKSNLCTYNHVLKGLYTTVAFSLTGGNILKWFRDNFGETEVRRARESGEDAYGLLLRAAAPHPVSQLVLPYFTPSGTPHFDARTPGAISGLRLSTSRGEILRALLEGVALEMRLNLEILEQAGYPLAELRAVGGGARSDFWLQLKADVTGKRIVLPETEEAGCLGAAMLACAAHSGRAVEELAAEWVRLKKSFRPGEENATVYNRKFKRYKQFYQLIREFEARADGA